MVSQKIAIDRCHVACMVLRDIQCVRSARVRITLIVLLGARPSVLLRHVAVRTCEYLADDEKQPVYADQRIGGFPVTNAFDLTWPADDDERPRRI